MRIHPKQPTCPECSYDMTGVPLDEYEKANCPECGRYNRPPPYSELQEQKQNRRKTNIKMITLVAGLIFAVPALTLAGILLFALLAAAFNQTH